MEPVTTETLAEFLSRLGQSTVEHTSIYLLGGSALSLLGNPRTTLDIDYTTDLEPEAKREFEKVVADIGAQLQLDVEAVPIDVFIPLPPGFLERRRFISRYGNLEVYVFDLYSIALSKIARGFESDIEDVLFMLRTNLINFIDLERFYHLILPEAPKSDIDPKEFKQYFEEMKRQYLK